MSVLIQIFFVECFTVVLIASNEFSQITALTPREDHSMGMGPFEQSHHLAETVTGSFGNGLNEKTTSREIHGRGDPSSRTAPPVLLRLGLELKTVQQGTQRVGHSPSLPCDE